MLSNRFAVAALIVACIGAAAGGGYLASRQMAAHPVPSVTDVGLSGSASPVVQETEAVVEDSSNKSAKASAPTQSAKPSESSSRATSPAAVRATKSTPVNSRNPEPLPTLDRTWPSNAGNPAPSPQSPVTNPAAAAADSPSQVARNDDRAVSESPHAPEPPQKSFEELVVPGESVIGLQAETSVSSERARVEDRVEAHVTRDVRVRDMVAIPAGTRAVGSVTQVEHGGRFKERARLGIRFHTLVLADGTRIPIQTETIYRYGDAPGNESAAKIGGGATVGAIIGAIIGGGKGAAIGATAGAGAGTASVMAGERNAAAVRPGEPITVRITSPVAVTVEEK
jgi:hypothetical protein